MSPNYVSKLSWFSYEINFLISFLEFENRTLGHSAAVKTCCVHVKKVQIKNDLD